MSFEAAERERERERKFFLRFQDAEEKFLALNA